MKIVCTVNMSHKIDICGCSVQNDEQPSTVRDARTHTHTHTHRDCARVVERHGLTTAEEWNDLSKWHDDSLSPCTRYSRRRHIGS